MERPRRDQRLLATLTGLTGLFALAGSLCSWGEGLLWATPWNDFTHLMITDPVKYAEPFIKAGSDLLTFHIEVTDEPMAVVEHIRSLGARVGVTLNPGTDVSTLEPVIEAVDLPGGRADRRSAEIELRNQAIDGSIGRRLPPIDVFS